MVRLWKCASERLKESMSAENAQILVESTYMQEDGVEEYLEDLEKYEEEILGGLSVLNEDNNLARAYEQAVEELALVDRVLEDNSKPDTSEEEASIVNNESSNENETMEVAEEETISTSPDDSSGAIVLAENLSDLNADDDTREKVIHLELDPKAFNSLIRNNGSSDNSSETYTELRVIDGVVCLVNTDEDLSSLCVSDENEGSEKNDENASVNNQIKRHTCHIEDCAKRKNHELRSTDSTTNRSRPYRCTHSGCKKSFSTAYSLKAHLRTHTGEKPYKCTTADCDKSFKTSGDLLKHVRTHTGERPFVCPFDGCGRSFTTSNIRKVHIRTHTGERPFKCTEPDCGKAFASSTNYKNHIRIHSGEKPYVCTMKNCGRRFTEYSSLYKHHTVHTQDKRFECGVCGKRYRQTSTLLMHRKTAHTADKVVEQQEETRVAMSGDDELLDVLLENSMGMIDQAVDEEEEQPQILLLQDPSQLVPLRAVKSFDLLDADEAGGSFGITLEELNAKLGGAGHFELVRWNL